MQAELGSDTNLGVCMLWPQQFECHLLILGTDADAVLVVKPSEGQGFVSLSFAVQGCLEITAGQPNDRICLDVAANAHGVAVCSPEQAIPFLEEVNSISVEPLALVSTAPLSEVVPAGRQVKALRFPAIYGPTAEPILIAGALIQLGDAQVLQAASSTTADQVKTGVVKICVYKDQWSGDWELFTQTPVKVLTQHIPLLTLCKGNGCGAGCPKFHASIDEAPDAVILELWGRKFQHDNGTKAAQKDASAFQVMMRVPASAVDSLQQCGTAGVYIEPREAGSATGPCHSNERLGTAVPSSVTKEPSTRTKERGSN